MTRKVSLDAGNGIATVRIDHPPVNALGHEVRTSLMDVFRRVHEDTSIKAVVLVGAGRCFIAGADIKEFGKDPQPPLLREICNMIEATSCPVVASLHGVSLGGGLEVALAAHYRVAQSDAKLGLPEVRLGLIPGAGGTQRLPRLVGTEMALDMITSGRHVSAQEAFDTGLLDKLVAGDPVEVGRAYAQALLDAGTGQRPTRKMPCPESTDWDERFKAVMRSGRGQIAPAKAVRAVQASTEMAFDAGLQAERTIFVRLMQTDQRKALIHAFFAERAVRDMPDIRNISPRQLDSAGVVGGGTMGAGIATSALLAGLQVSLVEQNEARVQAARNQIAANLTGAIKRGKISATATETLLSKSLHASTSFGVLAHADVVVEAVFEDMAVKRHVFMKLDKVCKLGAILATNTSYLDVNEIAAATSRPSDVIGLHFFSPAHVMKLLEVVVHDEASPQVVATGFALGQKLGKTAVWSGLCEGFIGNRILHACRTAADHMVLDGASPFAIDEAMVRFGYPIGPFQVSDLAGLDIGWAMRKRRADQRDPRERVGRYADVLCEAGHFGQKTGRGFYVYSDTSRKGTRNPEVEEIIRVERAARGIERRRFHTEEIQRRYLAAMVNEAANLLEEGIARRPLDVDVVLLAGYAFPRHHGGPCKWADLKGLKRVLDDVREFAREDDYFWQPAPLLEKLVAEGRCFDDLNKV